MENLENELQDAPKLRALKKRLELPQAPEGYFDQMEEQVLSKLKTEGAFQAKQPTLTVKRSMWWRFAAAATLVGICALGGYWYQTQNDAIDTYAAVDITPEDAEAFLMENIEHFVPQDHNIEPHDLPNPLPEHIMPVKEKTQSSHQMAPSEIEVEMLKEFSDEDLDDLI